MTTFTLDIVKQTLPTKLKSIITQELVDSLNNISNDPDHADTIKENFISYAKILQEPHISIQNYINAIKYCSYKIMGESNIDSWIKTFPDKYQSLRARGCSTKDISSHVTSYHKSKTVNLILERAMVPVWLLNQDMFQQALNVQATIMNDEDVSPMHRVAAANSVLTHLKRPEVAAPSINIDMRETSGLNDLKDTLNKLAKQQLELIEQGVTAKSIAEQKIIEGEVIND